MSGSGAFAVYRSDSDDRLSNNQNTHRHHNQSLQQHRLRRRNHHHQLRGMAVTTDADNRTDSDDSNTTLSISSLLSSLSLSCTSRSPINVTNLDSFLDSVTPIVPAQNSSETSFGGEMNREAEVHPFYCLGDLWEAFREWSAYGAGVPLLLYGRHPTTQYYVPFLSGMQLYVDPQNPQMKLRFPGEENDVESLKDNSSSDTMENEADRQANFVLDESALQGLVNNGVTSDKDEDSGSPEILAFEYMEQEQPHSRRPLADKVSVLVSKYPELSNYRSCDLSPSSWICVAWYPIYRIPMGPTLKDLEASFLTFHSLSTQPGSNGEAEFSSVDDDSPGVRLPVIGLVSYKLKGSIITPYGPQECEQENALFEAATNWLHQLQALLPDYQFFVNRYA